MRRDEALVRISEGRTDLVFEPLAGGPLAEEVVEGASVLQWCAYYGDVGAVRHLLDHGGALTSLGSDLGLRSAAFHGHWKLCEFLIERGADVNAGDDRTGETPLHSALCTPERRAHDLVLAVLLARGADPNRTTKPAADTDAFMRDARTKGERALHRAAAFGTEETIGLLLRAGARREAKDANGDTPLGWASWYARPDSVLRMLCYGEFAIRLDRVPMARSLLGKPHGTADANS